jgi:hypothetical protein
MGIDVLDIVFRPERPFGINEWGAVHEFEDQNK